VTAKKKPLPTDHQLLLFSLFTEIGIIQQLSSNAVRPLLPKGMSMAQYGILNHFARRGGTETPAQLASAFQVTKGAMTHTLQRLEAQHFVKIKPDPADARRKLVSVTSKGLTAHAKTGRALVPYFTEIAAKLDVPALLAALPALQALRAHLDDARDIADT